jgi:predicted small secreted protein
MKTTRKFVFLAALSVLMAGCATVDGVGRDLSGAARTVQGWF